MGVSAGTPGQPTAASKPADPSVAPFAVTTTIDIAGPLVPVTGDPWTWSPSDRTLTVTADGVELTGTNTNLTVFLTSSVTDLTLNNASITAPTGDAAISGAYSTLTLDLIGTNVLKGADGAPAVTDGFPGRPAMTVSSLTIRGDTLIATGGSGSGALSSSYGAGANGGAGASCITGPVTIEGATVTLTGGNGGAGGTSPTSGGGVGASGGSGVYGAVTVVSGSLAATGGNGGHGGSGGPSSTPPGSVGGAGGPGGNGIRGAVALQGGPVTATGGTGGDPGSGATAVPASGGTAVSGTATFSAAGLLLTAQNGGGTVANTALPLAGVAGLGTVGTHWQWDSTAPYSPTFSETSSPSRVVIRGTPETLQVITLPLISTPALPGGIVGTAYSESLSAVGAGVTWSLDPTGGPLPDGLTLSPAGAITGTPTARGSFTFTVIATNGVTPAVGAMYTVSIASNDATLRSVAGNATAPVGLGTLTSPKTATHAVPNSTTHIVAADLVAAAWASTHHYSDALFTADADAPVALVPGVPTHVYVRVTAEDGVTVVYYDITVTRELAASTAPPAAVTPSPSAAPRVPAALPFTGTDALSLGLLAALLVIGGLAATITSHRRRGAHRG
jgi:hypothetical protein